MINAEGIAQVRADLIRVAVILSNTNITLAEKVNNYLRKKWAMISFRCPRSPGHFGLSRGHFSRLYKQETDITAMKKLDETAEKLSRENSFDYYQSLDPADMFDVQHARYALLE